MKSKKAINKIEEDGQNTLRFQTTELSNESKEQTQLIDCNQSQKIGHLAYTSITIRDVSTATDLKNGRLNQVRATGLQCQNFNTTY